MNTHDQQASAHRKRAAELREIAAKLSTPERRKFVFELADDYERRAVAQEKLSKRNASRNG